MTATECTILYATQSGRAKACARRTARILRQGNVRLRNGAGSSFDECSIFDFANESADTKSKSFLLLFVSTTGDGEQVDAMQQTWKQL
jgi:sulfite reductase alpha subunit-like flavoprotein